MTFQDKYHENENMIENLTDFLLHHDKKVYMKETIYNQRLTAQDQDKLIDEIASLRTENKLIRTTAIVEPQSLKYEYHTTHINQPSQFNTAGQIDFKPQRIKRSQRNLELR